MEKNYTYAYYEKSQDMQVGEQVHLLGKTDFPYHFHKKEEITYMARGEMTSVINGANYRAQTDDIVFISYFSAHSYSTTDDALRYLLTPRKSEHNDLAHVIEKMRPPYLLDDKAFNREKILPLLKEMLAVRSTKLEPYVKQTQMHGLFLLFYGRIAEGYADRFVKISNENEETNILELLMYIDKHFTSKISLDELARAVNLNKFAVSKIFNKYVGMNLNSYVNNLRLEKFLELCKANPDENFTTFIYECGFDTPSTFYREFKKSTTACQTNLS